MMRIQEMLEVLAFASKESSLKCELEKPAINSRIYAVGQVRPGAPGVVLGEREEPLKEKNVGTFLEELRSFGERFQNEDFLIQHAHTVSVDSYELRFYRLTHIEATLGGVVLKSSSEELQHFREVMLEPDLK